jgi:hypothetical protein
VASGKLLNQNDHPIQGILDCFSTKDPDHLDRSATRYEIVGDNNTLCRPNGSFAVKIQPQSGHCSPVKPMRRCWVVAWQRRWVDMYCHWYHLDLAFEHNPSETINTSSQCGRTRHRQRFNFVFRYSKSDQKRIAGTIDSHLALLCPHSRAINSLPPRTNLIEYNTPNLISISINF